MENEKSAPGDKKFWTRMYIIVGLFLVLQVVFYYYITQRFS